MALQCPTFGSHSGSGIAWCLTALQCPTFGICGTEHGVPVMAQCPVDWQGALQHCSASQTGVVVCSTVFLAL